MLKNNTMVLFQGDSITDAGRSRVSDRLLGSGYPAKVRSLIKREYPESGIRVINRGISGNRATDLLGRWENDCIALKPDYVSILIGVNDTWRRYDRDDPTSSDVFRDRLRIIIEKTLNETPAQIILLNPFLLDINEKITAMREDLCLKQEAVAELSKEYRTKYLDTDALFREAAKKRTPAYYALDGVHPTKAGHELIAKSWLSAWQIP
jgi:acyl-CoA thioesterase I